MMKMRRLMYVFVIAALVATGAAAGAMHHGEAAATQVATNDPGPNSPAM